MTTPSVFDDILRETESLVQQERKPKKGGSAFDQILKDTADLVPKRKTPAPKSPAAQRVDAALAPAEERRPSFLERITRSRSGGGPIPIGGVSVAPPLEGAQKAFDPALQGAALGFGDEVQGFVGAALDQRQGVSFNQKFRESRDRARARIKQFDEEAPFAATAMRLAGGLATAPLLPLRAASAPGAAAALAAEGAVTGIGESEVELTQGLDLEKGKELAADAATGAALSLAFGAGAAGARRVIRAGGPAAKRLKLRAIKRLSEAAGADPVTAGQKLTQASQIELGEQFGKAVKGADDRLHPIVKEIETGERLLTANDDFGILPASGDELVTQAGRSKGELSAVVKAWTDSPKGELLPPPAPPIAGRIVNRLASATNAKARNELVGRGGRNVVEVAQFVRSDPIMLRNLSRGREGALFAHIESRLKPAGEAIGAVYDAAEQLGKSVDLSAMLQEVNKVKALRVEPERLEAKQEIVNTIVKVWASSLRSGSTESKSILDAVRRAGAAGNRGQIAQITFQEAVKSGNFSMTEMHKFVQRLQNRAFKAGKKGNVDANDVLKQVAMNMRRLLNDTVDGAAPEIARHLGVPDVSIRALNKEYSMLKRLDDVSERSAVRALAATQTAPRSELDDLLARGRQGVAGRAAGALARGGERAVGRVLGDVAAVSELPRDFSTAARRLFIQQLAVPTRNLLFGPLTGGDLSETVQGQ